MHFSRVGALLLGCAVAAAAEEPAKGGMVTVLTSANWESTLAQSPDTLWFVKFYAPWCSHCKRLAPAISQIAEELQSADANVRIGRVDATVEKDLAKRFDVHGYPTLLLLASGGREVWEYNGLRNKAAMLEVLERMQRPPVAELPDVAALAALAAAPADAEPLSRVDFVLSRDEGGSQAASDLFRRVARLRQPLDHFSESSAAEVRSALHAMLTPDAAPQPPFVMRISRGEPSEVLLGSELATMDDASLEEWVKARRLPLFSLVDKRNFPELLQPKRNGGRSLVLAIVHPGHDREGGARNLSLDFAQGAGLAHELRSLAFSENSLRKSFIFGMLDGVKFVNFTLDYRIETFQLPRLLVLKSGTPLAFRADEEGLIQQRAQIREWLEYIDTGTTFFPTMEYEGNWGLPARWWREAKAQLPALSHLDALPAFSFVALAGLFVLWVIVKILLFEVEPAPQPESFVADRRRLQRAKEAAAASKQD